MDLYQTLGIRRDASPEEIRRAYRREALKWHPDKNPDNKEEATRRFREISRAYEVLNDPSRRRRYDMYGDDEMTYQYESSRTVFRDPFEVFRAFFGNEDPFVSFFSRGRRSLFDDDDDFFSSPDDFFSSVRPATATGSSSFSVSRAQTDVSPFSDPFFSSGSRSFQSSFSSMSSAPGKSVSSTTTFRGDEKVTIIKTTIRTPDGSVSVETKEIVENMRTGEKRIRQL